MYCSHSSFFILGFAVHSFKEKEPSPVKPPHRGTVVGYLLVNNPVFQLEPYGLSVLCCALCAVGCCDNTRENVLFCPFLSKAGELGALLYLRFCKLRVFCFLGTSFSFEWSQCC